MLYKTILLHRIQELPELYDRLLKSRALMATLDRFAVQLQDIHEEWKNRLRMKHPDKSEGQIASEATELALSELETVLHYAPIPSDGPLSLDGAIAFISRQVHA